MAGLIALALQIITTLLFWWAGRDNALAMGIMVSQRNMGLLACDDLFRAAGGGQALFRRDPGPHLLFAMAFEAGNQSPARKRLQALPAGGQNRKLEI